jgi:MFS transporter, DHA1 family, multidrug resistance protein
MTTSLTLSQAQRKRGLGSILLSIFFMWGGFFMVIPLIAVHYVDNLGWAAAAIGLVLALRQLGQQGLTFIGGMLADRLGAKGLICAGLFVRALGFLGMAWADTFAVLLATSLLASFGGALFEAPRSAAIAALTDAQSRARFYALSAVVGNLGMTLGIFVGALLLQIDFRAVALLSGGVYFLAFLLVLALLPAVRVAAEPKGLTHGMRLALRDKPFMTFNVLLIGYWFMWVQFSIALPLAATKISGTSEAVSWIYALNAGMSIILQYPLLRLAERWFAPLGLLKAGIGMMATGLGLVALASSVGVLLACVALFSLGGLLAAPNQQTVTANLASPRALGSYFGVAGFGLAIGGGLGNLFGGLLYGLGESLGMSALPWLVFAVVGLVSLLGLNLFLEPLKSETVPAARPQTLKG